MGAFTVLFSLGVASFFIANNGFNYMQKGSAYNYSFLCNKDNAPTLTGANKEQKEVVATGLGNPLYLTYSQASNVGYAHAVLANGGYISNNQAINDTQSLVVTGSGSFKLGYGIDTITNYINLSLDDSSYTLEGVSMNYFKLVATSNNAVVYSISGTDTCASKAEFGVREYSTSGGTYTDKWTRLIHDVPSSQAFTYSISWTQTETVSANANNPRIFLIDADALYNADDSYVTVSDTNSQFGCRGLQFRQDWDVDNYITAANKGNNVSNNTAAGASKAGVANAFVNTDGTIFTTGVIDDASGQPVSKDVLGWSKLRVGATVTANITYLPESEGLHEFTIVWTFENTVSEVDWSFTMTQRARFSSISNLALAIGSANCNWTVLSSSCTGLN